MKENNKGITLIALIITIIVLLILLAITVDVAIDGKLFDKTEKAVSKTNNKVDQIQNGVDYWMGKLEEESSCVHEYGEWEITKEATCTEIGSKSRACTKCGYVEMAEIKAEHTFSNGECTECGAICSHTYGEWEITKEATCTEIGSKSRACTKCGYIQTEEITINHTFSNGECTECGTTCSHTYGEWEIITAATCTATGSKERTCTECGQGETEEIEALGHSYGEWEITTAATCTTVGTKTKTCATCGAQKTRSIEALGHTYESGTCSVCGSKEIITFTVAGMSFYTEYGTTWYAFLLKYDEFSMSMSSCVHYRGNDIYYGSFNVNTSDVIVSNRAYLLRDGCKNG